MKDNSAVRAVTTHFVVDRPIWSICPQGDRTKLLFRKIKKLKHVKFFKSQAASSWFHETDNTSIVCSVSVMTEFASCCIFSTSRSEAFTDETCI